jgi:sporulation-control protein
MFETLLASTGIGSTRIDLKLDKAYVKIGEAVTGNLFIQGGQSPQTIEGLAINFQMESVHALRNEQIQETIATVHVVKDEFTVQAKEEKMLPFSFTCPVSLPISTSATKYYFDTDLAIKWGLDSHDRDYIDVWPPTPLKALLDGLTLLGCKKISSGLYQDDKHWLQLLTFQPTGNFSGKVERLIISFLQYDGEQLSGRYHVDRAGTQTEFIDFIESEHTAFQFSKDELSSSEQSVAALRKWIRG